MLKKLVTHCKLCYFSPKYNSLRICLESVLRSALPPSKFQFLYGLYYSSVSEDSIWQVFTIEGNKGSGLGMIREFGVILLLRKKESIENYMEISCMSNALSIYT